MLNAALSVTLPPTWYQPGLLAMQGDQLLKLPVLLLEDRKALLIPPIGG